MNTQATSFAPAWHARGYANAAVARQAEPDTLQQLGGRTMGTTWSLRLHNPTGLLPLDVVRAAVAAALARVVAQMSHWEPESDLSRFNRAPAGSLQILPAAFARVLGSALDHAKASQGALDPTVGPLVALWGFGPEASDVLQAPAPNAVRAALAGCGWQRLPFDASSATLRQPGGLTLDFSGIAKGFAVDHVVDVLRAMGLTDLLFEVGGELRGIGRRPGGAPWTVHIAAPEGVGAAAGAVGLSDLAVATSGDRWHHREHAGRHWSHTIDPRTGEPVAHALASVTVLHAQCMDADALATVLTVLGPVDGPAFARSRDVAALFFMRTGDGLRAHASPAWVARAGA